MSKALKKGLQMYEDLEDRKEYNETINILPTSLKNKTFLGNKLLIKMFQHTESPLTPQGVLKPQYLEKFSEEGRPMGKLDPDSFKWSSKALVVAVPPAAQSYMEEHWKDQTLQPGDIIELDQSSMDLRNRIPIDRLSPIMEFTGFMKIHPSNIDFKYNDTLSLTYEQTTDK